MVPADVPSDDEDDEGGFATVVDAYWDQSASRRVYDALDELFGGDDPPAVEFAEGVPRRETIDTPAPEASVQAARHAVSIQERAAKVAAAVAAGTGARAAFFWQPSVFTKRLLPEEEAYLGLAGYEPARWVPAVEEARALAEAHTDRRPGRRTRRRNGAGALGLRAHERGGRPARCAGTLREPRVRPRARRGKDPDVKILGISAFYHDSAAALVVDGQVVAAAQEERFTRKKHDAAFPANAIAFCLRRGEVGDRDLDAVVYYDKPITTFVRLLKTYLRVGPKGLRSFSAAMPAWTREKLWIPYEIERGLQRIGARMPKDMWFTEHHESHAASAFFPSPFEHAAILTFDGVGEWATSSIGVRARQPDRPAAAAELPQLARAPVLRVHVLLRVPRELGGVQAHGARARTAHRSTSTASSTT